MLLAAEGPSTRSIAKEVGVQPRIVSKWRHRFADHGLAGLNDRPLASKKPIYSQATNRRILALLDKLPPGYARWTGPLLAMPLQDVDVQYFCASTTSIEAGRLRDPTPSLSLTARPSLLVAGTANANA